VGDLLSLVEHRESVPAGQAVEQAYQAFREHPHAFAAVVDEGRYVGLISRGHLGFLLGTRYGFALHSGHLIQHRLLPDSLVADPAMSLLALLERALARTGETFYQDVPLVAGDGRFLGIIPVPALVRAQSALVAEQVLTAQAQQRELLASNQELFRSLHQLRQSQGRYDTLFQNSPLAVALLFPDGRIDHHNERLEAVLGAAADPGARLPNLADLMPLEQRAAFLELLRRHESGALPAGNREDEFQLECATGGRRLFQFHTSLVRETGQICTILQDVTERRALERRLALHDKTALFESLAGGIAHELNNTLTPVLGYAELISTRLEGAGDSAVLQSYCRTITKSAQESVRIIRQLLQLSRPATMELREVELGAVLEEAVSIMRFRLRASQARLELDVPGPVRIMADPGQIKQVIINLLMNAVDAMEHTVRKDLRVRVAIQEAWAELAVEDTGHGIAPDKLNRVFDPFFTTKSAERGTGLGLSVCLGIVGQHQGEMSVTSAPGEGTRFRILLPLKPAGLPAAGPAPARSRPPDPGAGAAGPEPVPGQRVLVIDDEEYITMLVDELLRGRLGWRIEQVHGGREAVQRLEAGAYDLVITDLRMPGLDGFAVLGWIREFRPELLARVLVLTGDAGTLAQDAELGGLGLPVLSKPFNPEDLLAWCRERARPRLGHLGGGAA